MNDGLNDLNQSRADLVVSYDKIRSGRKISAIRFKWRDRTSYNDINYDDDKQMTIDDY